jgi:hypothetical protein
MRNTNIGSISSGKDLIPDFVWELEHQTPTRRDHWKMALEIRKRMETDDYYQSEDASRDLESLSNALDEYSPEYFYFGSNLGDGADYGWWLIENFESEFDGLTVDDLAEVPRDYYGEVLVVSDHGNMTLYRRARNNRLVELWAVV